MTSHAEVRTAVTGDRLTIAISGDLVLETVADVQRALAAPLARGPRALALDLAAVHRLDASGVAVAVGLHRFAKAGGLALDITGIDGDRKLLVDLALRGQDPTPRAPSVGIVREVGEFAGRVASMVVDFVRFCGEVSLIGMQIVRRPSLLRWRDTVAAMSRHGNDAVPVVGLLGFLIGVIIAFQTYDPMAKYGAKLQVADVVGVSVVRELGPLMTAILITGRSGAAYAAELGTMTVNEEIDALRTLGQDPQRFLVFPRVLAMVVVVPAMTVVGDFLGTLGGMAIAVGYLQQPAVVYVQMFQQWVDMLDVGTGLMKSVVFGIAIGLIACQRGLATRGGADGVGRSTTSAVVVVLFALVALDAAFTWIFSLLDW